MVAIQIIFPWGRYYAHPWGLNPVRLREAEWPPSPWRLLRALASSWFRAHAGNAPSPEAVTLIEKLGRSLPEIGIGKVAFGQTVHYQPNYGAASAAEKQDARYKKTRHENHFAAVHGPLIFRWSSVDLSPMQEELLARLLADLSYFGRSESICQAELITAKTMQDLPDIGWCCPTQGRKISAQCRDVFCPRPADFQITDLWARRDTHPNVDSRDAPKHLVDALLRIDMRPDGAKWISYKMPSDWPSDRVIRVPRAAHPDVKPVNDGPRIARYLRFSLQCRVPVPRKFTVPIADQFRKVAGSHFCKDFGNGQSSFALFGKDPPKDVIGEHQHAFYLPTRGLGDDESTEPYAITEMHVWCPYGFTRAETQVLLRVQRLVWKDGRYPVRPVLTAMSKEPPIELPLATGSVKSRVWRSETPFAPPRHFYRGSRSKPRMREADSPERQLIECLRQAKINTPGEVRRLALLDVHQEPMESMPPMPLWSIVRALGGEESPFAGGVTSPTHKNGSNEGTGSEQRIGFFFEIRFDSEVALPMPAFGCSNHFGLGLFVPARSV